MPKAKTIASLSGLIDTDMEDDTLNMETEAFPTPDSNQENALAKKKAGRGKPPSKRFTKPKTAPRRASGESIATKKPGPKKNASKARAPLKEQMNAQHAEDTEEVDEFEDHEQEETAMDELLQTKVPAKRKALEKKVGRPPKRGAVEEASVVEKDGEFEYTPTTFRQNKGSKRAPASRPPKAAVNGRQLSVEPRYREKFISETQAPTDTDPSALPESNEIEDEAPNFQRANNVRVNSRQQRPPVARRRAGSASDTDRGVSDPALRRKLGDMTRKFESMELRYRNLREGTLKDAEDNFQKYKKHTEAKAKGKPNRILSCHIYPTDTCQSPKN